ncbi:hypothetical protein [Pseudomonas sp. B21-048]|uniref:hypothetical protein n=1 Tax=Pseudomonas sp. B21-048 TaxID=2895490 RepID=UPI00215F933E|nr:hypothetical protein [Pseudomonas sp. B21-048]UVK97769.1 hypothetical protein LOY56_20900 [Pseudomonas sp. B21-048]
MNTGTYLSGWLRRGRSLAFLTLLIAPSAGAVTQEIRALFTPDSANPQRNQFINKTPLSGYCEHYPDECRANNMFSIRLPLRFESVKAMQPDDSERNSAMFRIPAQWRALTVTHAETGQSEKVEVRIAGFGSQYVLSDTAVNLTGAPNVLLGHQSLWGSSSWVYAAPPCVYSGVGLYGDSHYAFFWKTPVDGTCVKTARFPIPAMSYSYLDFAYELRTPNPLGMSSGLYNGALSYSIGPGADFDFGDIMQPSDSDLTLDFVLDVQHTLKVDIPPGGEKVRMVPAGGWQSWLQGGRKPTRIFRDQTFNISASSRFKMYLECQFGPGRYCYMSDGNNVSVPIEVSVSLPAGLTDTSGRPVNRQELKTGPAAGVVFQPGQYVDRKPGTLHFELHKEAIDAVLLPSTGKHYRGTVVVVWDSEV